eukprot:455416_1
MIKACCLTQVESQRIQHTYKLLKTQIIIDSNIKLSQFMDVMSPVIDNINLEEKCEDNKINKQSVKMLIVSNDITIDKLRTWSKDHFIELMQNQCSVEIMIAEILFDTVKQNIAEQAVDDIENVSEFMMLVKSVFDDMNEEEKLEDSQSNQQKLKVFVGFNLITINKFQKWNKNEFVTKLLNECNFKESLTVIRYMQNIYDQIQTNITIYIDKEMNEFMQTVSPLIDDINFKQEFEENKICKRKIKTMIVADKMTINKLRTWDETSFIKLIESKCDISTSIAKMFFHDVKKAIVDQTLHSDNYNEVAEFMSIITPIIDHINSETQHKKEQINKETIQQFVGFRAMTVKTFRNLSETEFIQYIHKDTRIAAKMAGILFYHITKEFEKYLKIICLIIDHLNEHIRNVAHKIDAETVIRFLRSNSITLRSLANTGKSAFVTLFQEGCRNKLVKASLVKFYKFIQSVKDFIILLSPILPNTDSSQTERINESILKYVIKNKINTDKFMTKEAVVVCEIIKEYNLEQSEMIYVENIFRRYIIAFADHNINDNKNVAQFMYVITPIINQINAAEKLKQIKINKRKLKTLVGCRKITITEFRKWNGDFFVELMKKECITDESTAITLFNDIRKETLYSSEIVYSLGVKYWYSCWNKDFNNDTQNLLVKPHFKNLKEETIDCTGELSFSKERWNQEVSTAEKNKKKQECKDYCSVTTQQIRAFGIKSEESISVQHLIAVQLYCNTNEEQQGFSASYYKVNRVFNTFDTDSKEIEN